VAKLDSLLDILPDDTAEASTGYFEDPQRLDLLRQSHEWTLKHFPQLMAKLDATDWRTESVLFDDPGFRSMWTKIRPDDLISIEDTSK
jgi:hypothetical protein